MERTIWCLFSVENNYDQPNNNLEAWWVGKPSMEQLCMGLDIVEVNPNNTELINEILSGKEKRLGNYDYRLEEIKEGKYELK